MALPVVSASVKKNKKPSLVLTLLSAGLLISGGIATYWLLTQFKPFSRLPPGANIIPQDALFAVSVTTDTGQWQQLRQYGTSEVQAELDKNLLQLRDRFLTNNGYDFQKDIKPWVGEEVTIAVLTDDATKPVSKPVATDSQIASGQQMMMVLPIKDPQNAKNILTKIKALQGKNWSNRTYQGITIEETDPTSSEEKFSAALIDGEAIVITDNPQATNKAIDAYKAKTVLAKVPGFSDNFSKISNTKPFAQFYINVPQGAKIASASPNRQLPAQVLAQLQNNQGLAGTITLESEGIRLKGISWLNPNSQRTLAVENNAGEMPNRIPAETIMMLSGTNLTRVWADYVSTSQGNPLSPIPPEQLRRSIKTLTNLDLERDLLSWMGGEFAISVVPISQQGTDNNFREALVFMVQVSDRARADASLKQLDEVMRSQYQFQIKESNTAGKSITNWVAPFGTLTASHGWLDDDVVFITLGAPINDKIVPKPSNSLANTSSFQKTVPSELGSANGQFFLDVERTAKNFPLPALFPNQQALLDATRSIGITSAISDNRSTLYDVFVTLKKVKN